MQQRQRKTEKHKRGKTETETETETRKEKKRQKGKREGACVEKKGIVDKAASNENSSDFPSVFQADEGRATEPTENEETSSQFFSWRPLLLLANPLLPSI